MSTLVTATPEVDQDLRTLCVNTIRTLSIDGVERANSGHPGAPMGLAPAAFVIWSDFLKHNPRDPGWPDRDRFILSAGHASMLLYSLLHLTGYALTLEDLKRFRQLGSRTPGHPEHGHTPGVETTTGPLGQGFATGVGMAMAERYLAERFNRHGFEVVDHRVLGIVSDGDLMEGVASEAASLAGHLQLGKLVYLYDSNRISIDGPTDLSFTEDVGARFEAYGWHVSRVADGNDLEALRSAFAAAIESPRPSLIVAHTNIGFGAPHKQDSNAAHGAPLGADEVAGAKRKLGMPEGDFVIADAALEYFRASVAAGVEAQHAWIDVMAGYQEEYPSEAGEYLRMVSGELPEGWDQDLPAYGVADGNIATRKASGAAINAIAPRLPELVGGSADLAESNLTDIKGQAFFDRGTAGRNIHFGVREHAMGAALNGMALHRGIRPFGGTFLIFSDYARPAVRLAALMNAPSIFVFTHDSIGLGEDGPTHQPVEHLASLRAMPGLVVLRPGDANETVEAWRFIAAYRDGPVAICLTRQGLPVVTGTGTHAPPVARGAYVLSDPSDRTPEVILMATGSELQLAVAAAGVLASEGVATRVVSMPSWELFQRQDAAYRELVLPPSLRGRVSVEAASTFGWERWVGDAGESLGLDRFGASGPGDAVMMELGFSVQHVIAAARRVRAGTVRS